MSVEPWAWVGFNLFILLMLALDLGVFHKKSHVVGFREALGWSAVWVTLALIFNAIVYAWRGPEAGLQFLTGYLIEKSLSVDNIFVFLLVFTFFGVPALYQHKILFWGVLGALVMRAALIVLGAALIQRFHWIIYVFGGFLVLTGIKMAFERGAAIDLANHPLLKFVRRVIPVTDTYHGDKFFVRQAGRWIATPMFLVLVVIEFTDLVFAVDSIPAIFAITTDPFLVYTSNVFAILGLRSLYFALAGIAEKFHLLKLGLAAVLVFVGTKMLIIDIYKIPVVVSLGVVASVIGASVVASLLWPKKEEPA